jgi:hypothetical protein
MTTGADVKTKIFGSTKLPVSMGTASYLLWMHTAVSVLHTVPPNVYVLANGTTYSYIIFIVVPIYILLCAASCM